MALESAPAVVAAQQRLPRVLELPFTRRRPWGCLTSISRGHPLPGFLLRFRCSSNTFVVFRLGHGATLLPASISANLMNKSYIVGINPDLILGE